jgi:hypothetical protein
MPEDAIQYTGPLFSFWALAVISFLVLPFVALLGWLVGRRTYRKQGYGRDRPAAAPGDLTVGAMLTLLGLLMAFSFGFSLSRAEARKVALMEEAAAIGTAFLRADLLAEPGRSALRETIGAYALTRLADENFLASEALFREQLRKTVEAQNALWPITLSAISPGTPPAIKVLVVNGITDVLDAGAQRLAAIVDAVPLIVKGIILAYASASLFLVGNNAALRGRPLSWRTFLFSTGIAVIMMMVIDIERPQEGFVRAKADIMRTTVADIEAALATES